MKNIAVLASYNGSGLDVLYDASVAKILDINIVLIISNNTNSVVLQNAKKYNIPHYLVNSKTHTNVDDKIHSLLQQNNCEYIFLSGYMKKLSKSITEDYKVINSHPSLLPLYGGTGMYGKFVHQAVIKNNEKVSGVTIHEVNEVYDEGKIILQKELILSKDENPESLEVKIKKLEKIAILEGFQLCLK